MPDQERGSGGIGGSYSGRRIAVREDHSNQWRLRTSAPVNIYVAWLSPLTFLVCLLAALGYVLWRGGTAERAGVSTIAIGSVLSAFVAHAVGRWSGTELGVFAVDVAVLVAFIVIMGSSRRFWPLWITSFQIISVATHLVLFVKPKTVPVAYAVAEELWAYPMLAILVAVVWRRASRPKPPTASPA